MAVDEWLLETVERPTLRVYGWDGKWGSVGYFGDVEEARRQIPGRQWVRRRTGGGTVDHAADWTYTVVVPAGVPLAKMRGGESYRLLHEALAVALAAEGVRAEMSLETPDAEEPLCFSNPAPFDLLGEVGKLAGAGQRRTRHGLLHQGSVAGMCEGENSLARTKALATCLCWEARQVFPVVEGDAVGRLMSQRYGIIGGE